MSEKKPARAGKKPAKGPGEEAAFLAAIAAQPDEDTPRLAFADWLDEHGRADEAELIRVQVELEPIRERYGEARHDELSAREEDLLRPLYDRDSGWSRTEFGHYNGVGVEYRRGFPDAVALPARYFVERGAHLRARFPLLRKLTVFRLNGWGERLAACEHLRGLRELDLPCWYEDADAAALAASPHLADLEVLHYWRGRWPANTAGQLRALAAAWPKLRRLRVVLGGDADRDIVNEAAGRAIGEAFDPGRLEHFPMRADFCSSFLLGKFADGRQFFGDNPENWTSYPASGPVVIEGQLFDADGNPTATTTLAIPPELVHYRSREGDPPELHRQRREELRKRRNEYLRARYGFEPAFIRVKRFDFRGSGPYRDPHYEHLGSPDDPGADPAADYQGPHGYGRWAYGTVMGEEYSFDAGNHWVCDKTGTVVFT